MSRIHRKPPHPPKTHKPGKPGDIGRIRPMYGIAIRDDLTGFRSGILGTISDINKAVAAGQLKGTELTEAHTALGHLNKALGDLKRVGVGPIATGNPATGNSGVVDPGVLNAIGHGGNVNPGTIGVGGGVIRPMYGIAITDDLQRFRNEINQTVTDINKAINNGQLKGQELTEAKQAATDLKTALADLKFVPPSQR
jgi:hypothetical protein